VSQLAVAAGVVLAVLAMQVPVGGQFMYSLSVPMVEADGRQGSGVYVGGHVRTAAHVVRDSTTARAGGETLPVSCADVRTDSATMVGSHGVELKETAELLGYMETVTIAGWPLRRYYEGRVAAVWMLQLIELHDADGVASSVGPVYVLLGFAGNGRGMSGGPVIRAGGDVAATVVGFGEVFVFAVPVSAARCRLPRVLTSRS